MSENIAYLPCDAHRGMSWTTTVGVSNYRTVCPICFPPEAAPPVSAQEPQTTPDAWRRAYVAWLRKAFDRHEMAAGDAPAQSRVVLASSLKRLLERTESAQEPRADESLLSRTLLRAADPQYSAGVREDYRMLLALIESQAAELSALREQTERLGWKLEAALEDSTELSTRAEAAEAQRDALAAALRELVACDEISRSREPWNQAQHERNQAAWNAARAALAAIGT